MITHADWMAVFDQFNEEERQRLGPLPEYAEIEMYFTGRLDADAAARIADFLVAHPDIAKKVLAPFPEEGEQLTSEQIEAGWERLQGAITGTAPQTPAPAKTEFSLRYYKDLDGKPAWFRAMTDIGPQITTEPSEAARFESAQAAMKSPAFASAICPLNVVPAPDVPLSDLMDQLRADSRDAGEIASELAGKPRP